MSTQGVGAIVFACLFGGALGGMFLHTVLPEHHRTKETEDVIRLGMGVLATMGALVVGLLLASTKNSFDARDTELQQFAGNLILLDRQLVHYGPETKEARDLLRRFTVYKLDSTWPTEASHPLENTNEWTLLEDVQDRLRALAPATKPSTGCKPEPCRSAVTSRGPVGSCACRREIQSPSRSW